MTVLEDRRLGNIRYLSLGAGVQSTALLILSDRGLKGVPRADCAIFADTGAEPAWVYENVERLRNTVNIPIHVTSAGRKIDDLREGERFVTPPLWIQGEDGKPAPCRRQCTREYKIEPIERKVRELMGYRKGERVSGCALSMIGISLDESRRMKNSLTAWVVNTWPLIDARMTRKDCIKFLEEIGYPRPLKSSCYFCPYHSDEHWQVMKTQFPEEWKRAMEYDRAVRNWSMDGFRGGGRYCHASLKPLDEIDFTHGNQATFDFFDMECEGMCGV